MRNLNFFIKYISILNIPFFLSTGTLNINLGILNFKLNPHPTSSLFYLFLFLKKIKKIYIIFIFLSFIEKIKIFIVNILKFFWGLLLSIKNFIIFALLLLVYYINKYLLFMISDKYHKIFYYLILLSKIININPIIKFITDKKKFKIIKFKTKEEKADYIFINKHKEDDEILFKY